MALLLSKSNKREIRFDMYAKILGLIWMLLGVLWVLKPGTLKNRFQRKLTRKIKFIVYGSVLVFGFFLIASIVKIDGIYGKIIGIAGLLISIKVIMLITSKTTEMMFEWISNRSLLFFRVWGAVLLGMGIVLVLNDITICGMK